VYLSKKVVVEEKDASEAACVGAVQGVERGRAAVGAVRETRRRGGETRGEGGGMGFLGGKKEAGSKGRVGWKERRGNRLSRHLLMRW